MVFLTFVDDERGFVLTENFVCENTNYGRCEARNIDEPADWLPRVSFPAHRLVVRTNKNGPGKPIAKGVTTAADLKAAMAVTATQSDNGVAWVEPDMRTHLNPTRMRSIRRLAFKLARRLATRCPSCAVPG